MDDVLHVARFGTMYIHPILFQNYFFLIFMDCALAWIR